MLAINLQQRKEHYEAENNNWHENKDFHQDFPFPQTPQPSENNSKKPPSPNDDKGKLPELPHSDRTKYLEAEIEHYKRGEQNVPENEKQSFQRIIEKLEKELEAIKTNSNSDNVNYENWTSEQLINEIKKVKSDANSLKKINSFLEAKMCKLEAEIRELKAQEKTPEIRHKIQIKETELKEIMANRVVLNEIISDTNQEVKDNNSKYINYCLWGVGGVVLVMFLVAIYKQASKKKQVKN